MVLRELGPDGSRDSARKSRKRLHHGQSMTVIVEIHTVSGRSRRVYRLVCFSGCNGDDPTPDDPVALGHAHRVRVGICALNQILPANRYRVGWKHRGSLRLPICPKHARAGDLPY